MSDLASRAEAVLNLFEDGAAFGRLSAGEAAEVREVVRLQQATLTQLREALETIRNTFARDEAQGYRSRDRRFAIEIAEAALHGRDPETRP